MEESKEVPRHPSVSQAEWDVAYRELLYVYCFKPTCANSSYAQLDFMARYATYQRLNGGVPPDRTRYLLPHADEVLPRDHIAYTLVDGFRSRRIARPVSYLWPPRPPRAATVESDPSTMQKTQAASSNRGGDLQTSASSSSSSSRRRRQISNASSGEPVKKKRLASSIGHDDETIGSSSVGHDDKTIGSSSIGRDEKAPTSPTPSSSSAHQSPDNGPLTSPTADPKQRLATDQEKQSQNQSSSNDKGKDGGCTPSPDTIDP